MTLMTDYIEVWRAPLVGGALSQHREWGAAVRAAWGWGSLQPDTAERTRVDRETSPMVGRAYLPPQWDVRTADRLTCNGRRFEVIEEPEEWRKGSRAHIRVVIQEVTSA